jgi:hypothetical protein
MKAVFRANNGKVFEDEADARHEDRFIEEVRILLEPFEDVSIKPGEFVQRNSEQVQSLIDKTYRLLLRYYGASSEIPKLWKQEPRGFVGRYLDDGNSPAYSIYGILLSIDNKNRQWQQPYYALEANKGNYPR